MTVGVREDLLHFLVLLVFLQLVAVVVESIVATEVRGVPVVVDRIIIVVVPPVVPVFQEKVILVPAGLDQVHILVVEVVVLVVLQPQVQGRTPPLVV